MKLLILVVFLIISNFISLLSSQVIDSVKKANELYLLAIQSINSGKYDEAISKCDSAMMFNPGPVAYPYEKSLALYKKNQFNDASIILDSLTGHPEVNPQVFQLLGNCYDAMDNSDKAIEVYKNGLAKFPKSGRLLFEIGLNYIAHQEVRKALGYWESGIINEPQYSNNYLVLSKYYYKAGFTAWSVIYGEIFSNISESDFKVKEISNLLFEFYKNSFYFLRDSTITIQFTTSMITSPVKRPNKDLPFDMAYQSVMQEAAKDILPADSSLFSIDILFQLRKKFIELWYAGNLDKTFSNVLFEWHKNLIDKDIFEVYNYFLFSEGAPIETKSWVSRNQLKIKRFQTQIYENFLKIDEKHFVSKHQYQ
jgi:hypothetical protein